MSYPVQTKVDGTVDTREAWRLKQRLKGYRNDKGLQAIIAFATKSFHLCVCPSHSAWCWFTRPSWLVVLKQTTVHVGSVRCGVMRQNSLWRYCLALRASNHSQSVLVIGQQQKMKKRKFFNYVCQDELKPIFH